MGFQAYLARGEGPLCCWRVVDRRGASVLGTKAAACPNPTSRTEPESKRIFTSVLVGRGRRGRGA
jgi:hypothetical protein